MAITFYDDIQTPKLEIKDSSSVFVIGFQAQGLIADAQYHLPPVPVANGQVLSSNVWGVMFWIDVASRDYIASRSGNLISNFSGHFRDNTNFSKFTYDPLYSPPSFKTTAVLNSLAIDELIVVDTNETYKMSVRTRWLNSSSNVYSMGLECLDVDERVIKAKHTMYKAGTTTYVTQDVAEGDNYIYVYSLDNWNETGTDIERSFIFWDEVSQEGYNYPSETYSRHVLKNAWETGSIAYGTDIVTNGTQYGSNPQIGTPVSGWYYDTNTYSWAFWNIVGTLQGIEFKYFGSHSASITNVDNNGSDVATVANTTYQITYQILEVTGTSELSGTSELFFIVGSTQVSGDLSLGSHTVYVTTTDTGPLKIRSVLEFIQTSVISVFTIYNVVCKSYDNPGSPFDTNLKRISLRESWNTSLHGPLPVVNTILSNGNDQGTYSTGHGDKYMMNTLTNVSGDDLQFTWMKHTGTIGRVDTTGTGDSSKFFPGTHSVKPKWEIGGSSPNTLVFNNLFFGRDYFSNEEDANNIGNSNIYITPNDVATYRRLYLGVSGGSFSIYKQQGGDSKVFEVGAHSVDAYKGVKIKPLEDGLPNKLIFEGNAASGSINVISLEAPLSVAAPNAYVLPKAYPGVSGLVLGCSTTGTMSWQAGGTGGGGEDSIYHTVDNATGVAGVGYYYDSLAGSKHLAMILQNRRADIIQHGAISVLQAWSESITSWVTLTLPEDQIHYDGVQALLDGRRDTSYNVPNGLLKFRFQVEVSTPWPLQTMVAVQTGWTAAGWPQPQILVEEFVNGQWDVLVTADFTNANGVTGWGLAAYASQGLHTGQGGSGLTRITVDCSNFVSQAGSTTVPLQNLYISSNYYGDENTGPAYHDYNNIINYDRDLVIPNSIRHEGNPKNHIALGSNSQTYYTDDVERALINNSGFRLGGSLATVTGISADFAFTPLTAVDTLLVTQLAVAKYIGSLLYDDGSEPTGDDEGLSPGMIGDGNVSSAQWGFLNSISGDVQTQITNTVYYTTANSNTLSAHATAITAIQNTLKDTTGGGGKGVYSDSGKATTSSHLSLTGSTARIQAGGNTSFTAEESSPGTLTMSVQSGQSGSEQSVTAITVAGSSTFANALTTFSQAATFSMPVTMNSSLTMNSTLNLNGTVTGLATTQVTEGTNLYYTDARAQAAVTAGTNITITAGEIAASTNTADIQTYLSGGSATTIETSGDVTVGGNLIVSGTQTQLNTTTLEVEDINIVVGKLATTSTLTNGAGLTFGAWSSGTTPTLTWDHANTRLSSNKNFYAPTIKTASIQFDAGSNPSHISSDEDIVFHVDGDDSFEVQSTGIVVSGNITLTGTVDGIDIATDVAANTAKTGITSAQAAEITANTAQASAITANTAKTGITAAQANEISANTLKVSNVSTALGVSRSGAHFSITSDGNTLTLDSASSTLWGIMTDEQVVNLEANTLKTGITSTQASLINSNATKVSYSTAASDAVALNTAKTGITTVQATEIEDNTEKVGISPPQASAITANTAKVSNIVQTTITGNAGTATQLENAIDLGGISFNGLGDIDFPGVNETGNQDTTGNAATATTLATARNIGGVSFNGSAAITLPGVNAAGTQDTSGNAATATKIASITNTDIVQLAGAQTLSGVKTFSSSIVSPGITSASNGDIVIDPHGTGSISLVADEIKFITGTGGFHGTVVKLFESSLLDGSYFYLAAPATMNANWGLKVPEADGTQGQVMKTSGAGVLSWTSVLDGTNDTLLGTTSVKPVGGTDGRIAFYENGNTNYVVLQAHDDLASNYTLRLPTADGSADQTLKTDGSGNLGWSTPSSGGGAVDLPLMTLGGRIQHSTSYDNRMIICGGTYGPTYYIWSSPLGITTSGGGTVDTTTFTLTMTYQHYGAIRVPTAGKIKVDFIAKPLNSGGYSKPYVLQIWEFTPAIGTSTGPTCTLRAKVDMTSSSSSMQAAEATMTTTSDIAAGKYVFVTVGMDAQTLTSTAYQYMNINLSILA